MRDWSWIDNTPKSWAFLARVIVKALLLFVLCNATYVWLYPAEWLGNLSLYGTVYPARPRLPYGENPSQSYNVSLNNLPALFTSHTLSNPKPNDEYRVILIGDSNTWGWLLDNYETLSAYLNQANLKMGAQDVMFFNLGYPVMSLTKDLLILDYAMQYEPDMVIWLVSLASFPPEQQLVPPLVQHNQQHLISLIERYDLRLDVDDSAFVNPSLLDRTIIGQRRQLAGLLRLQSYGFAWVATGIDQMIPETYDLRQSDLALDYSWEGYSDAVDLSTEDLAFDVLNAGIELVGDIPIIIVNEPMFISAGENSDIRYNSFYPRWAYDQYRQLLTQTADSNGWQVLDVWDTITSDEFTDSPVHLTADGTQQLAQTLIDILFTDED